MMGSVDPLLSRSSPLRIFGVLATVIACCATVAATAQTVPQDFDDTVVASGGRLITGFAFFPDGRMIATEFQQAPPNDDIGEVHIIVDGVYVVPPILSIPNIAVGSERGLLGVAVDPGWPVRPYVYFYFTHLDGHCYLRMYEATGDLTDPLSTNLSLINPYEILNDIPDNNASHNGGTLRFGPDGMLYVSSGEDGDPCAAVDLTNLLGGILRLDVANLPGPGPGPPDKILITPNDNPFAGPNENEKLYFCYGLRNPYHFSIDPVTGTLYIGDVGGTGWEELDESTGGEFFGWPRREGAHSRGSACPGDPGIDPIWEYEHAEPRLYTIIGGPFYRQTGGPYDFPAEYDGDVFFVKHYARELVRLKYDDVLGAWDLAPPVPGQPAPDVWANDLARISDIQVGPDGAIYYSEYGARIRRISYRLTSSVGDSESPAANAIRLAVSPNPATTGPAQLRYSTQQEGTVRITLHSVGGQRLATLFAGTRAAGRHQVSWDRRLRGARAPAGVYFVRVATPDGTARGKLVLR